MGEKDGNFYETTIITDSYTTITPDIQYTLTDLKYVSMTDEIADAITTQPTGIDQTVTTESDINSSSDVDPSVGTAINDISSTKQILFETITSTEDILQLTTTVQENTDRSTNIDSDELIQSSSSTIHVESTPTPFTNKHNKGSTPSIENKNTKTPENQRKLNNNFTNISTSTAINGMSKTTLGVDYEFTKPTVAGGTETTDTENLNLNPTTEIINSESTQSALDFSTLTASELDNNMSFTTSFEYQGHINKESTNKDPKTTTYFIKDYNNQEPMSTTINSNADSIESNSKTNTDSLPIITENSKDEVVTTTKQPETIATADLRTSFTENSLNNFENSTTSGIDRSETLNNEVSSNVVTTKYAAKSEQSTNNDQTTTITESTLTLSVISEIQSDAVATTESDTEAKTSSTDSIQNSKADVDGSTASTTEYTIPMTSDNNFEYATAILKLTSKAQNIFTNDFTLESTTSNSSLESETEPFKTSTSQSVLKESTSDNQRIFEATTISSIKDENLNTGQVDHPATMLTQLLTSTESLSKNSEIQTHTNSQTTTDVDRTTTEMISDNFLFSTTENGNTISSTENSYKKSTIQPKQNTQSESESTIDSLFTGTDRLLDTTTEYATTYLTDRYADLTSAVLDYSDNYSTRTTNVINVAGDVTIETFTPVTISRGKFTIIPNDEFESTATVDLEKNTIKTTNNDESFTPPSKLTPTTETVSTIYKDSEGSEFHLNEFMSTSFIDNELPSSKNNLAPSKSTVSFSDTTNISTETINQSQAVTDESNEFIATNSPTLINAETTSSSLLPETSTSETIPETTDSTNYNDIGLNFVTKSIDVDGTLSTTVSSDIDMTSFTIPTTTIYQSQTNVVSDSAIPNHLTDSEVSPVEQVTTISDVLDQFTLSLSKNKKIKSTTPTTENAFSSIETGSIVSTDTKTTSTFVTSNTNFGNTDHYSTSTDVIDSQKSSSENTATPTKSIIKTSTMPDSTITTSLIENDSTMSRLDVLETTTEKITTTWSNITDTFVTSIQTELITNIPETTVSSSVKSQQPQDLIDKNDSNTNEIGKPKQMITTKNVLSKDATTPSYKISTTDVLTTKNVDPVKFENDVTLTAMFATTTETLNIILQTDNVETKSTYQSYDFTSPTLPDITATKQTTEQTDEPSMGFTLSDDLSTTETPVSQFTLKSLASTISTSTENLSSRRKDVDIPAWTDSNLSTDISTTMTYNPTTTDKYLNIQCKINSHCPTNKICANGECQNSCEKMRIQCAENSSCKVIDHVAVCVCDGIGGNNCLRGMHFCVFSISDYQNLKSVYSTAKMYF